MSHPGTALLADRRHALPDVQNEAPAHAIALGDVGVRGMRLPLTFAHGPTIATIEASVDLPAQQRGAHMSRFRKAIDAVPAGLEPHAFAQALAAELAVRHGYASRTRVELSTTVHEGDQVIDAVARASHGTGTLPFAPRATSVSWKTLGSTACPCAFAMSGDRYAHVQRAELSIELFDPRLPLPALHALASEAFSAPVAMVLDRPSEKALVDRMFSQPRFVEDVAREAVSRLSKAGAGSHARVVAVAFESIHPYDCFATWEGSL